MTLFAVTLTEITLSPTMLLAICALWAIFGFCAAIYLIDRIAR